MYAKDLAAQIRTAIRRATKTDGDALIGLTVSVRYETDSLSQSIAIRVRAGVDEPELLVRDIDAPTWDPDRRTWSARARAISDRLHELAAPALEWADHRHSHCSINLLCGLSAPAPRAGVDEPASDCPDERR